MRMEPVHVGFIGVLGGVMVVFSLIFFGFKAGELRHVTKQIAVVQSQNNMSMIIIAGIMSEEDPENRVQMIKTACPEVPVRERGDLSDPTLTPAESMCKTLIEIYSDKAKAFRDTKPEKTSEEGK